MFFANVLAEFTWVAVRSWAWVRFAFHAGQLQIAPIEKRPTLLVVVDNVDGLCMLIEFKFASTVVESP